MNQTDHFSIVEEEQQSRRDHLRFAAGMSDFVGVVIGVIVILLMVLLMLSLLNWLRRDVTNTFNLLNTRFQ